MLLYRIKTLLGNVENDELLEEILNLTQAKILNYLEIEEIPTELEFILIELCVSRFNRIGSEGYSSESIDGKNVSYQGDFESYINYLDDYKNKHTESKGWWLL